MNTARTYRRDEMRADAEAKGWDLRTWFRVAGLKPWNGYDFINERTSAPRVAEALTSALGKRPGYYRSRKRAAA